MFDTDKLWVKVAAKSDDVMFTSAWPKWKEDYKKRKWSQSRKSKKKKAGDFNAATHCHRLGYSRISLL